MPAVTKRPDATSRHRGVTRFSRGGRWQAFVKVEGTRVHLGMWADEDSAAVARDRCVLALGLGYAWRRGVLEWR